MTFAVLPPAVTGLVPLPSRLVGYSNGLPISYSVSDLANVIDGSGFANQAAASAADAAASANEADAAAANALLAATAAQGYVNILSAPATALPFEVTALSGGAAGTGGTQGQYTGGVSGAGFTGFLWHVTVSSGGTASYFFTNEGIQATNTAPTLVLPSGTGLTGATAPTATVGTIAVGRVFLAPNAAGTALLAWTNNAGALSQFPITGTQFSMPLAAAFLGGITGAVFTKNSDAAGDTSFQPQSGLANPPTNVLNLGSLSNTQLQVGTYTTSLSTRINDAVSGSATRINFTVANIYMGYLGTAYQIRANQTITVSGKINAAATIGNAGIGLCLSTTQPTPGGALITAPVQTAVTLRGNGALIAYKNDGATVDTSWVFGTAISGFAYNAGDTVTLQLVLDNTGAAGTLNIYINGIYEISTSVSGLPAGGWVLAAGRASGLNDQIEIDVTSTQDLALPFTKRIYLDVNASGTENGTESNPYQNFSQMIQNVSADTVKRELTLTLRGGIYRGSIALPLAKWRRINIDSVAGQNPMIFASEQVTSGWTQVTGTQVWFQPHKWRTTLNSLTPSGGLVDVTSGATQQQGRTLSYTLNWMLYSRLTPNTAFNAVGVIPGSMWMITAAQTNGAQTIPAGSVLVRCWGDANPNTRTFERSLFNAGVDITFGLDTDWNDCKLVMDGIECRYGYVEGVHVERGRVEITDCIARACSVGYGFQLNQCEGRLQGCLGEGNAGDGFNSAGGGFTDGQNPAYIGPMPGITFTNCDAMGNANLPTIVGDGFSNHPGQYYELIDCRAWSNGKDGLSGTDSWRLVNFDSRDNVNGGVVLAPAAGATCWSTMLGGRMINNNIGVQFNSGTNNNVTATMECQNVWLEANANTHVNSFVAGTGCVTTMNMRGCIVNGTTPTNGNVHNQAGTINVLPGTPLS